MAEIVSEGTCCVDCLMVMANDDWTGIEDATREAEVREGFDKLEGHAYATDEYDEFSSEQCDICSDAAGRCTTEFRRTQVISGRAFEREPVLMPLGIDSRDRETGNMKTYHFALDYDAYATVQVEVVHFYARNRRSAFTKVMKYAYNGIPESWELKSVRFIIEGEHSHTEVWRIAGQ